MKKIMPLCLFALSTFAAGRVRAATGAAFLKIDPGVRSSAMGSASTAVADDVGALYGNPAGLAFLSENQATATHARGAEMSQQFIGGARPTATGAVGAGFFSSTQGGLEGRDRNRRATGGFSAVDAAGTVAFSRRIRGGGLGASLKILQQRIGADAASGIAFDLGGRLQRPGSPLSLGMAVQNLGPSMVFIQEKYALPLTFSAGLGYRPGPGFTLAMDARRRIRTGDNRISLGMEYSVLTALSLRAGTDARLGRAKESLPGPPSSFFDRLGDFRAGVGFHWEGYALDYALAPQGDLDALHKISLSIAF